MIVFVLQVSFTHRVWWRKEKLQKTSGWAQRTPSEASGWCSIQQKRKIAPTIQWYYYPAPSFSFFALYCNHEKKGKQITKSAVKDYSFYETRVSCLVAKETQMLFSQQKPPFLKNWLSINTLDLSPFCLSNPFLLVRVFFWPFKHKAPLIPCFSFMFSADIRYVDICRR